MRNVTSGWKWWSQDEIRSWPADNKRCRKCRRVKHFRNFHKGNKKSLFGLSNECRLCRKAKSKREWADKSAQKRLFAAARARASVRSIRFEIALDDVVLPDACPVFEVPFSSGEYAPSLDRFYPELGYVKGNIFVVSKRANTLKNNAQSWELRAVAKWMDRVRGDKCEM